MPGHVDEAKWKKAKAVIHKEYPGKGEGGDSFWALVTSTYKGMGGKFHHKKASQNGLAKISQAMIKSGASTLSRIMHTLSPESIASLRKAKMLKSPERIFKGIEKGTINIAKKNHIPIRILKKVPFYGDLNYLTFAGKKSPFVVIPKNNNKWIKSMMASIGYPGRLPDVRAKRLGVLFKRHELNEARALQKGLYKYKGKKFYNIAGNIPRVSDLVMKGKVDRVNRIVGASGQTNAKYNALLGGAINDDGRIVAQHLNLAIPYADVVGKHMATPTGKIMGKVRSLETSILSNDLGVDLMKTKYNKNIKNRLLNRSRELVRGNFKSLEEAK